MCARFGGVLFLLVSLSAAPLWSAPPFQSLLPFRKIEADPNKMFPVKQEHGPWMILCASLTGPRATSQARELVYELRKRFKIEAYTHRRRYDLRQPVKGLGLNQYGRPKVMRHERDKSYDEIAVMAGNFESVRDSKAQKLLRRIKYLKPAALDIRDGRSTSQPLAFLRTVQRAVHRDDKTKSKGPMGKAFMTRNPTLPADYFARRAGVDDFVYRMNKNVQFSLLKNPARYTVRVASFRGQVMLDAEKSYRADNRLTNKLELAALKAHRMTEALRKKGVEAYEFHDRHESIVTVGGFDQVGTPRRDGKLEVNRAVLTIMRSYGAQQSNLPGAAVSALQPRSVAGIPFDVQPVPVAVPRVAIGSRYARPRY